MIGNCIRIMCRSPKSRARCHFAAAIGLRSMLEDFAPTIPDYALDMHTMKGKAMGRGLDHFRAEGAWLIPPPTEPDRFEAEAYRLWAIKQGQVKEAPLQPIMLHKFRRGHHGDPLRSKGSSIAVMQKTVCTSAFALVDCTEHIVAVCKV
jgi:hypothetical protein